MRVPGPVLCGLVVLLLAGCGGSDSPSRSTVPREATPADRDLGVVANEALKATRDRDVDRFCALLPASVIRGIGGAARCPAFARQSFLGTGTNDGSLFLVPPRPGRVREVVDASAFRSLTPLIDARRRAWIVKVAGSPTRIPSTADWRAALAQMTAPVRKRTERLAGQGTQCVVVVREAQGLRALVDPLCLLYTQPNGA